MRACSLVTAVYRCRGRIRKAKAFFRVKVDSEEYKAQYSLAFVCLFLKQSLKVSQASLERLVSFNLVLPHGSAWDHILKPNAIPFCC